MPATVFDDLAPAAAPGSAAPATATVFDDLPSAPAATVFDDLPGETAAPAPRASVFDDIPAPAVVAEPTRAQLRASRPMRGREVRIDAVTDPTLVGGVSEGSSDIGNAIKSGYSQAAIAGGGLAARVMEQADPSRMVTDIMNDAAAAAAQAVGRRAPAPQPYAMDGLVRHLSEAQQNVAEAHPYAPTVPNQIAAGVGNTLYTAPALIATGPGGLAVGGANQGLGGGVLQADQRRAGGEKISAGQEVGLAVSGAAIEGLTEYAGGKLTTGFLPKVVKKIGGDVGTRAAVSVGGNLVGGGVEERAAQHGQNVATAMIVDENKPGFNDNANAAFWGGVGGGTIHAPLTYQGYVRDQRQQAPSAPAAPPAAVAPAAPPKAARESEGLPIGEALSEAAKDAAEQATKNTLLAGDAGATAPPAGTNLPGTTPPQQPGQGQTAAPAQPAPATPPAPPATVFDAIQPEELQRDSALPDEKTGTIVGRDVQEQQPAVQQPPLPAGQPAQPVVVAEGMAQGAGATPVSADDAGAPSGGVPAPAGAAEPAAVVETREQRHARIRAERAAKAKNRPQPAASPELQLRPEDAAKIPDGFEVETAAANAEIDTLIANVDAALAPAPVNETPAPAPKDEIVAAFRLKDGSIVRTGPVHTLPADLDPDLIAEEGFAVGDKFLTREEAAAAGRAPVNPLADVENLPAQEPEAPESAEPAVSLHDLSMGKLKRLAKSLGVTMAGAANSRGQLVGWIENARASKAKAASSPTKMPAATKPAPSETLADVERRHPSASVSVSENDKLITLSKVVIPKEQRGQGAGTAFMQDLVAYADRTGKTIALSPSKDFGASSVPRLRTFYKRFGFVLNGGRTRDLEISESMYRRPDASRKLPAVQGDDGAGRKTPNDDENLRTTLGNELRVALDEYEGDGELTTSDLADRAESIAGDLGDPRLTEAVETYRKEEEDDRALSGRNDMDQAEQRLVAAIRAVVGNNESKAPTPAPTRGGKSAFAAKVDELKGMGLSDAQLGRALAAMRPDGTLPPDFTFDRSAPKKGGDAPMPADLDGAADWARNRLREDAAGNLVDRPAAGRNDDVDGRAAGQPDASTSGQAAQPQPDVPQLPARNARRKRASLSLAADDPTGPRVTRDDVRVELERHAGHHSQVVERPDGWEVRHPDGSTTLVRLEPIDASRDDAAFADSIVGNAAGKTIIFENGDVLQVPTTPGELLADPSKLALAKKNLRVDGFYDAGDKSVTINANAPRKRAYTIVGEEMAYHAGYDRLSAGDKEAVRSSLSRRVNRELDHGEAEEMAHDVWFQRPHTEADLRDPAVRAITKVESGEVFRTSSSGEGAGAGGRSSIGAAGGGVRYTVAGKQSIKNLSPDDYKRARDNLGTAAEMVRNGDDAEKVRLATGWFRNPYDKQWRYEIDDSRMRWKVQPREWIARRDGDMTAPHFGEAYAKAPRTQDGPPRLRDLIDHPDLFQAYPTLANMPVYLIPEGRTARGQYTSAGVLAVNEALPPDEARRTLLHEIQHAIQQIEGFAKGGNEKEGRQVAESRQDTLRLMRDANLVKRLGEEQARQVKGDDLHPQAKDVADGATLEEITKGLEEAKKAAPWVDATPSNSWTEVGQETNPDIIANGFYRNFAGEIEARDTASRADLTAGERGIRFPEAQRIAKESRELSRSEAFQKEGEASNWSGDIRDRGPVSAQVAAINDRLREMGYDPDKSATWNTLLGREDRGGMSMPAPYSSENISADEAIVRTGEPPRDGSLGKLISWAQDQLNALDADANERLAKMTPEQRKQRGSAGSLDPQRLILHGIIGAAKIAKGIKRFADWSAAMVQEMGERFASLPTRVKAQVWREAKRIAAMDDKTRAEYVAEKSTVKPTETTGQTVRRVTGQVKNPGRVVSEVQVLRGRLDALQKGSRKGFTEGQRVATDQLQGIKKALADVITENFPPEERGAFLGDIARARTLAHMRLTLAKVSNRLADYELRQAVSGIEKLVTKRMLDVPKPKAIRTKEMTEAEAAQAAGERMVERLKQKQTGDNLREIDLSRLPEPHRTKVRQLIAAAAAFRARAKEILGGTAPVEEKMLATQNIENTEREIRQEVADALNSQEIRVGERLVARDSLVAEVRKALGADQPADDKNISRDPPPERMKLRRLVDSHASIETIAANLVGPESDVYRTTVEEVRRGQEEYHGERMRFHQRMDQAFDEAGIPPGTKKLNDWLNEEEVLDLPDAGKVPLSRNQMVGLVASAGDPETMHLIERGVRWSFRANPRDLPQQEPFRLTPADVKAVDAKLTDGERGLIRAFKDYNEQDITPRSMQAKLDLSGFAPDTHKNYYPRARNRKAAEDAGLPEGWKGTRRRAMENVSSMKERAPDLTQALFVPEFVEDTSRYVEDAARLMHLAVPVRNAASLWEHPKVTQAVAGKLGESMNRRMTQFLEDTMQVDVAPPKDLLGKGIELIGRNVSRANLQLNPGTMGANIVGGTVSLIPEFDGADLATGAKRALSRPRKTYEEMTATSGVMWDRYRGRGLYGQYSPLTERRVESVANLKFTEAVKAGKFYQAVDALPLLPAADAVPFIVAWESSKAHVERTMPDATPEAKRAAAMEKFHDATYRTQNGGGSTEISGIASSAKRHPMLLALTMFKNDSNKKLNMLMRMRHADARTRAKTILAVGLNALASSGIKWGLRGAAVALGAALTGAAEDPEEKKKRNSSLVWESIGNLAGMSYLGDVAVDAVRNLYGMMTGGRDGAFDISGPVGETSERFLSDLLRLLSASYKWAQTEGGTPEAEKAAERMKRAAWYNVISGTSLAGVPVTPALRLGKRSFDAATFEPEDPRETKTREDSKRNREFNDRFRRETPGLVKLLDERSDLEKKGGRGGVALTPEERERKNRADGAARVYERLLDAVKATEDDPKVDADADMRLHDLLKRSIADADRLDFEAELTSLRRRRDAAAELRRARDFKGYQAARLKGPEEGRLKRLESEDEWFKKYEKQVGEGKLSVDEAAKRIKTRVQAVKRRQAA